MCTYISMHILTHLISSKGSSDHFRYLIYSKKTTYWHSREWSTSIYWRLKKQLERKHSYKKPLSRLHFMKVGWGLGDRQTSTEIKKYSSCSIHVLTNIKHKRHLRLARHTRQRLCLWVCISILVHTGRTEIKTIIETTSWNEQNLRNSKFD